MGFLTAFSRTIYLTNYVNKLQSKLTDMTEEKMLLADEISNITSNISDLGNSDSPAVKQLAARKAKLEAYDKKLEAEMKKIETKLQAAQTEMQSANQMLQQNIQTSFSYGGGGR